MAPNKLVIFAEAPDGQPIPGKDIVIKTEDFDEEPPAPKDGLILETLYLSLDPYQRQRMVKPEDDVRHEAFKLGEPLDNFGIARALKSNVPHISPGDVVEGFFQFATYVSLDPEASKGVTKIDNPYDVELSQFLGAYGVTGLTAYASLYDIGKPKPGETIFVSAASGAVGQIVGQLAKMEGLKVIGSVGSDAKLNHIINTLGFDGGFNYKKESPLAALKRLAPEGLHIYYDNVGGEQLDAALLSAKKYARFVMCGMVSEYSTRKGEKYRLENMIEVVERSISMRGFIQKDENMGPVYAKEHRERVGRWIKDGSITPSESITYGMDSLPEAFVGMLRGENFGKAIVAVKDSR